MNGFVNIFFNGQSSSKPNTIIGKISNVENVRFAYLVTGQVDAIAWVQAPDSDAFRSTLLAINTVPGVNRTNTNVAL